jgi:hypothetical protein
MFVIKRNLNNYLIIKSKYDSINYFLILNSYKMTKSHQKT